MNAPVKVASTRCVTRSSRSSGVARGVAAEAAEENADSMNDTEKVVTARSDEAMICRIVDTALAAISPLLSRARTGGSTAAASAVTSPATP